MVGRSGLQRRGLAGGGAGSLDWLERGGAPGTFAAGDCQQPLLLLRWLRVPHLASHVLGQALRRVGRDWQARYGYAPYLVETFVEAAQAGTCYRAANWQALGVTQGRGVRTVGISTRRR